MSEVSISLRFDSEIFDLIEKRAKKEFLSVRELIEDIIRRSIISWRGKAGNRRIKVDDTLVELFSREGRNRKKRRNK